MDIRIFIPSENITYVYDILRYEDCQRIECHGIVILDICKHHNHRYDLHGFFYARKVIVGPFSFRSKKELYGAIQKLLQEHL